MTKLFGDAAPPAWFASEVISVFQRASSSTPEQQRERKALVLFILKQAVKHLLSEKELIRELEAFVCIPKSVGLEIAKEYEQVKDSLRKELMLPKNFVSIHSRVLAAEFGNDSVLVSLSDREDPVQLNLCSKADELAQVLEAALATFDGL